MDNNKEIDVKRDIPMNISVRTDLAIEAREVLEENKDELFDGIEIDTDEIDDMIITHVRIINEAGSKSMGKPIGNYITIEAEKMKSNDMAYHEKIIKELSKNLSKLAKIDDTSTILVVGLGNWNVTPDALGPKVISKTLATRHIKSNVPDDIDESVRSVAAISPGVMGMTGIETGEIIQGLVSKINPDIVIAVDALAARRFNRINTTIQMSDTGISPGAGVGNQRMTLDKESLGVPVISIGVPTVVDAATLVNDTMDRMLEEMMRNSEKGMDFYNMLRNLESEEKYQLIVDILNPYVGNMFVTPKEVDAVVGRLANIIANSINIALHPGITMEDINRYVY